MIYRYNTIITLFCFISCLTCQSQQKETYLRSDDFPFDINTPDLSFKLSFELMEISGLTIHEDIIYAVQDEMGVLYQLDKEFGIKERRQFAGPGDYEALTKDQNYFYTLTSSGDIFRIPIQGSQKAEKVKTDLPRTCNFEGMFYRDQKLFVISKGRCEDKPYDFKNRCIFKVNLDSGKSKLAAEYDYKKLKEKLGVEDDHFNCLGKKMTYSKPKPSGMAVDPLSNHIYVLNAEGNLLVMLDENFELQAFSLLDRRHYPQAEGIVFDAKGNLYISSEGKNNAALLHKLIRQEKN